jgi:hypothetical protein
MRSLFLVISGFYFISCSNQNAEKQQAVSSGLKILISPASDSCAEPYLFTDKKGTVYLSWVEKKGKESTLKFSTLSNE